MDSFDKMRDIGGILKMTIDPEDFSLLVELAADLSRSGDAACSLALMRLLAAVQRPLEVKKGKPYLTTGEAAQLLGVSAQTVANWCESGKLQALRTPGGDRRIPADALGKALENNPRKGIVGTWKPLCPGCHHALKTTGQCRAATMYVTRINDPDFPFSPGETDNCRASALVRAFGGKTRVFENQILHDGRYKAELEGESSLSSFLFSPCELPGYGHDPRSRARQFGIRFPHCFAYNETEEGCSAMHSGKAKDVQKALRTCPAYCFLRHDGFRPSFDEYGKLWIRGKLAIS